ncbi:MBL fold metallo-hydrolase [Nocardiopsis changdeensis]|uniref:MBL fold metallo-hydrolase n=1 Tax=Nocardiopsis changdeensis TaxID=2831969 RepID=A0ABX8BR59_9ACTN|nr:MULTISPECIES: MBL fold metallo-hydrolase [Nocardiopsis]QUX23759.1 MBL fold metallo-hydrolase [Nocardiopsis changdeensis]QYX39704.1 MBL fold metallo-hydrolase [Nocardiopsis sp. MT53]
MFWKRKSKKQDGPEATDSAAEAAVDDTAEDAEEAGETEGAAGAAQAAEAEKSDKDEKTEKDRKAEEEDTEAEADEAGDADADDDSEDADSEDTDSRDDAEAEADRDTDEDSDDDSEDGDDEAGTSDDVFADDTEEAGVTGPDSEGITRVRAAVTFEFDDEKFEYIGNTWIVRADDDGVIVIDPGPDAEAVLEAVGEREVYLVACTNAYAPHIESALKIVEETEAPVALHPREMRLWRRQHGAEHRPDYEVEGGGSMTIGDLQIDVVALPGTSPGTVGYSISQLGVVFSGDTLRKGEPGMVGNTYIDYTTQLASIGESLLTLPPDTRILPDRGPATTVVAESKNFDSWV